MFILLIFTTLFLIFALYFAIKIMFYHALNKTDVDQTIFDDELN